MANFKFVPTKKSFMSSAGMGIKGGLAGGIPKALLTAFFGPVIGNALGGIVGGAMVGGDVGTVVTVNGVEDAIMFIAQGFIGGGQ